jgi:hypothetical protein
MIGRPGRRPAHGYGEALQLDLFLGFGGHPGVDLNYAHFITVERLNAILGARLMST